VHPTPTPFASVWFDCDSTLSAIEGVDELGHARDPDTLREVADLTHRAMSGEIPLAYAYGARLARLAPTRDECADLGTRYVETLVPDVRRVLDALRWLGKEVGVVSGGLLPPVAFLADHLGIPGTHVFAVPIRFADDGSYQGFDGNCPLTRNGGKVEVLGDRPAGEHPLAFVGDGVTDLEAASVVERFIGFGGVVRRPAVETRAECFAMGPSLATTLPFLLTVDEIDAVRGNPSLSSLLEDR
jgi:phosphoserine phosphatase